MWELWTVLDLARLVLVAHPGIVHHLHSHRPHKNYLEPPDEKETVFKLDVNEAIVFRIKVM